MNTPGNNMVWLVKREFWEHRGGFLWAPIITGIVFLALNLMGMITAEVFRNRANVHFHNINFNDITRHMGPDAMAAVGNGLDISMFGAASVIGLVLSVVVFFYCVNTLAEDRRDRSILFWKSLPLSDRSMVLAKVISAGILAPAIAIATSVVAAMLMLVMGAIFASFHGANLWQMIWTLPHPLRITWTMLKILPLYFVWALPTIGWLMLCSAWSRSKQFLWAVALPIGTGIIVTWFGIMGLFDMRSHWFWANVVGRSLLSMVPGGWIPFRVASGDFDGTDGHISMNQPHAMVDLLSVHNSYGLLLTPDFLVGAIIGIALIAGAIWLRRWRTQM